MTINIKAIEIEIERLEASEKRLEDLLYELNKNKKKLSESWEDQAGEKSIEVLSNLFQSIETEKKVLKSMTQKVKMFVEAIKINEAKTVRQINRMDV
jgi:hypothetical protein